MAAGVDIGKDSKSAGGQRYFGRGHISIGERCWVGIGCCFIVPVGGEVDIGDDCDIGPEVMFHCGSHEIGGANRRAGPGIVADIKVGHGTWIGARSTLLAGAVIGEGTVVAAGSVVLRATYPSNVLLAGAPAVVKRVLVN